jgi:peptide/nickel transport system permease protein
VLRSLVASLLSLFTAELVSVLVLNVFVVEFVFGIPGIGQLTLGAIQQRDLPLVLGTTMVVVFVGIGGSLLTDLATMVLDPRVDAGK